MDGSLKFIMKTQGVKGEEKQDKLDIKEEVETERGFVSWLKGIFRR